MDKIKKDKLVEECTEKMQELLSGLEIAVKQPIAKCELYLGDVVIDGIEAEGSKILLSLGDDDAEIIVGESELTIQEIIQQYHTYETDMKRLMSNSIGLPHITDKYLELIEIEKEECRKVIGEENKEYFKYL